MHTRLILATISFLISTTANAANWNKTFVPKAVATYLDNIEMPLALIPSGKPLKKVRPAAMALQKALRKAKGPKALVKVPRPVRFMNMDDAAIVAKLSKNKANSIIIIRSNENDNGAIVAEVAIYNKEASQLARFTAIAGTVLAAKSEASETTTAEGEGEKVVSETTEGGDATVATIEPIAEGDDKPNSTEPSPTPVEPSPTPVEPEPTTDSGTTTGTSEPTTTTEPEPQPDPTPVKDDFGDQPSNSRSGILIDLAGGIHRTSKAVGDDSGGDVDESFAIEVHPAWRFSDSQALGVSYFHNMYSMPESTSMLFHGAMLTWRYYLPLGSLEPFAEVGAGWCWLRSSATSNGEDIKSVANGLNFSGGLGLIYNVFDFLGVGIIGKVNVPMFTKLCVKTGNIEACGTPSSNMKDISAGLTISVKPF